MILIFLTNEGTTRIIPGVLECFWRAPNESKEECLVYVFENLEGSVWTEEYLVRRYKAIYAVNRDRVFDVLEKW